MRLGSAPNVFFLANRRITPTLPTPIEGEGSWYGG